jgi:NADPH-dependent glutamate synthase beta subunit-like oxidoreductase/Pyruvate/2-oxoacid:ferredoxin oxidoreductase delta subunit
MEQVNLTIDGTKVTANKGATVLEAALAAGIYIPALCAHPDLPAAIGRKPAVLIFRGKESIKNDAPDKEFDGCGLCVVEIGGMPGLSKSCATIATEGMVVVTNSPKIQEHRRDRFSAIISTHPHYCITCDQKEGCSPFEDVCQRNVTVLERCCPKRGACEIDKLTPLIGIKEGTPRYTFKNLPILKDEPLIDRDYNLCINCTRCVRVCQDVRGIGVYGFVYRNGEALVGTLAPTLKESGCKFCGACVEVCPTGALMDRGVEKAEREAALVPCKNTCPAAIDVPRYVRLIGLGKPAEALAVIREKVPFPNVLGNVCFHPCEAKCRRGQLDEPVSICTLKRFAAENDKGVWQQNSRIAPATGKKVAVVGAGPAGLTVAYYLAKKGHAVIVFEALPEPGGMMRVGIPEYRLPKNILAAEMDEIRKAGVEIKTNSKVESVDELLKQGYNAVVLALGAHRGHKLGIPGDDSPQVIECVNFLREVNLGKKINVGSRVAVIGGGNAAVDAARVALRLGAKEVEIVYRRTKAEMPAATEEIEGAIEEGVKITYLAAPSKVITADGKVKLECLKMQLGETDDSGRRRPEPIPGSGYTKEYDTVIAAIGQMPDVPAGFGVEMARGNTIKVNWDTLEAKPGVFAAGDAVSGPTSVIEAIAAGRKAATSVDRFLGGNGNIAETLIPHEKANPYLGKEEGFADRKRVAVPHLKAAERIGNFSRIALGFNADLALKEARRCLQCDLRFQISAVTLPPEKWLEFNATSVAAVPKVSGVLQLLDADKKVIYINGVQDLHQRLEELLGLAADEPSLANAKYFLYEENYMYTLRESELMQSYLKEHGSMPACNMEIF